MVSRLMGYYKASYSPERIEQLKFFCAKISQSGIEDVFNHIIENRQKDGAISVADIKESAIAVGVPFTITRYVEVQDWTCDCCGHEYKYAPVPTDDDKIDKAIFDYCPICGFQAGWTITRNEVLLNGRESPEWYARYLDVFRNGSATHELFNKEHPFFNRIKAERDRRDENRRINDQKMLAMAQVNQLAESKRYDLDRD